MSHCECQKHVVEKQFVLYREFVLSVSDHISNIKVGEKRCNVTDKSMQQKMPDLLCYVKVFEHINSAITKCIY